MDTPGLRETQGGSVADGRPTSGLDTIPTIRLPGSGAVASGRSWPPDVGRVSNGVLADTVAVTEDGSTPETTGMPIPFDAAGHAVSQDIEMWALAPWGSGAVGSRA